MPAAFWITDQTQAAQHSVYGHHRQRSCFSGQQLGQLSCAPVRTLGSQLRYALLQRSCRTTGAVMGPVAVLLDAGNSLLLEPAQPQIPRRTADLILPAQCTDRLSTTGADHKLNPTIPHTSASPAHPPHLAGVKDLLITMCKASPDTEQFFAMSGRDKVKMGPCRAA